MRTIIGWFLAWLIIIYSIFLAIGISYQVSGLSKDSFKQAFVASGAYQSLSEQVTTMLADSIKDIPKSDPSRKLASQITPFIPPDYLQSKIDGLIDQTAIWLTSKNSPPPILSFADIKETLITKNPKLLADLASLDKEYQAAKPELESAMKQQAQESGEAYTPPPTVSFQSFIDNDFTIPMADYLGWLKPLAWTVSWLGIIASICLVGICCLGVFFLHPKEKRSGKIANLLILTAGILNAYLLYRLPYVGNLLQNTPLASWSMPKYLYPIIDDIINPLLFTYYQVAGVMAGVYLSAAYALRRYSAKISSPN